MQVQLHSISRDYGIIRGHLTITSKQDDENLIISSADLFKLKVHHLVTIISKFVNTFSSLAEFHSIAHQFLGSAISGPT